MKWTALMVLTVCLPAWVGCSDTADASMPQDEQCAESARPVEVNELKPNASPELDYQLMVDRWDWSWSDGKASLLYSMTSGAGGYDVRLDISNERRHVCQVAIRREGETVYEWASHAHGVFKIRDDRLYYARWHHSASGADLIAIDLKTGETLWEMALKGIGPVQHFAYRNLLNLDVNREVVTVWGYESMGRYVEVVDTGTGKTIANKVFEEEAESD